MQKVLIAYASRYGSTRDIAEAVSRVLGERGVAAPVRPADGVPTLEPYRAVVLGSAVYEGEWLEDGVDFLRRFRVPLSERPVWLFSSGTTDTGAPTETMKGWTFPGLLASIERDIAPQGKALFGGRLDSSRLSFGDWLRNPSLRGVSGDFRDWGAIEAWAGDVATALTMERAFTL